MATQNANQKQCDTDRPRPPNQREADYQYPDPKDSMAPIIEEFKRNLDKVFPLAEKNKRR